MTHPSLPAPHFTAALGLEPRHSGTVGESRRTPKGNPLPGEYKESFWSHSFATPKDSEIESFLITVLEQLSARAAFFSEFQATGGRAQLFIGFFLQTSNTGFSISPGLQRLGASLGISFGFDIYDTDEPGDAA